MQSGLCRAGCHRRTTTPGRAVPTRHGRCAGSGRSARSPEVHKESGGTCGPHRVTAPLTHGQANHFCEVQIALEGVSEAAGVTLHDDRLGSPSGRWFLGSEVLPIAPRPSLLPSDCTSTVRPHCCEQALQTIRFVCTPSSPDTICDVDVVLSVMLISPLLRRGRNRRPVNSGPSDGGIDAMVLPRAGSASAPPGARRGTHTADRTSSDCWPRAISIPTWARRRRASGRASHTSILIVSVSPDVGGGRSARRGIAPRPFPSPSVGPTSCQTSSGRGHRRSSPRAANRR